jgi:two-component system, NarL family, sensor histidine kinase UhpB
MNERRHITTSFFRQMCFVLVLVVITNIKAFGQAVRYTYDDSIRVYKQLDQADELANDGRYDAAVALVDEAVDFSNRSKFYRGHAFALLKLADLKLKQDGTDKLDEYYIKAKQLSAPLNDPFLSGLIAFQQAQQKGLSGEYADAEKLCYDALAFFSRTDSTNYLAISYNQLGFTLERAGRYEEAARNYLSAIPLFEKINNVKEAANTQGNLAVVFFRLGRKEDAISMFKQSAVAREGVNDVKGLAATYGNLATVYMPINDDSARKYFNLQLQFAQKSGVKTNIAQAYVNNMTILGKQKKYPEALEYELKAIRLFQEMGDKNKLGIRYANAAMIYQKLNDSLNAEKCFSQAEQIGFELKSKSILQNLYLRKSEFYKEQQDYLNALSFTGKYYQYRDSIISEKTATNIAELQTKYETEKKDNEIQRLRTGERIQQLELERQQALLKGNLLESAKKEQEIQLLTQDQLLKTEEIKLKEEQLARQALIVKTNEQQLKIAEQERILRDKERQQERFMRQIIIGAIAMAAIMMFILFSRYKLKRKLDEQKKIIEIRDNISRDLHDEIGSTLTSINILSTISQQAFSKDPEQAKEMLQQISTQSKTVQQNMSDIVWAMRPDNESIEDLEIRMREFAAQTLEMKEIETHFQFDQDLSDTVLTHETRKQILIIYKEAVTNIAKHADASLVKISFEKKAGAASLMIEDNGIGIRSRGNHQSGTGTKTMEQRANMIGGNLTISRMDYGTRVLLTIPLP